MKICVTTASFIGVVSLLIAMFPPTSRAQEQMKCIDTVLPAPVVELLKSKFIRWRPKQVSDMDADDQRLWLQAHEKGCPGIAVGHFESADRLSYATLLVPKSEPSGGYKIVLFSKESNGDGYTWKLLDHAVGQTYSGLVISKASQGKYSDFESTKSVELKLDGIYVEWMEKGALLYYLSEGHFRKIQVSD
jgi:hypothetical protein